MRFPHARDEGEIARLVVALPQAAEDADDLGIPLRAEAGVVGLKVLVRVDLR